MLYFRTEKFNNGRGSDELHSGEDCGAEQHVVHLVQQVSEPSKICVPPSACSTLSVTVKGEIKDLCRVHICIVNRSIN